jgi:hypothetical protein
MMCYVYKEISAILIIMPLTTVLLNHLSYLVLPYPNNRKTYAQLIRKPLTLHYLKSYILPKYWSKYCINVCDRQKNVQRN